jgi:putative oxidoreductase
MSNVSAQALHARPGSAASALSAGFDRLGELSYPLVRLATGLLLVPHGAQKLFGLFGGYGVAATGAYFDTKLGLHPGIAFAALAGFIEFFGGLALALGLLTRLAALGIVALMTVAVFAVHLGNGFFWTAGGFEYPLMWGLLALAILLRGGGSYSLDRRLGLPL